MCQATRFLFTVHISILPNIRYSVVIGPTRPGSSENPSDLEGDQIHMSRADETRASDSSGSKATETCCVHLEQQHTKFSSVESGQGSNLADVREDSLNSQTVWSFVCAWIIATKLFVCASLCESY